MKKFIIFGIMLCILATTFCSYLFSPALCVFADSGLDITSKSALLFDVASQEVLFEKNSTEHLPVASMVKMMTILLIMEEIDNGSLSLDTMISTTENASGMGGSQIFIDPFVEYKAEDLLKGIIIASANDASVAMAEHISGSEKTFVTKMNDKAKELGMNDTHYSNCTGLPAPEQYSCAKDSALLLNEVIKHDTYHNYSTIWMDEVVHPSGRKTGLVNTNRLIRYYDGCDGGKTGSTNEAGCCLSASSKRGDMRLISVIVGASNSQTRFNECSSLFNYGFANFENKTIFDSEVSIKSLPVNKGKVDEVSIYSNQDFSLLMKKGDKSEIEVTYELPESVKAPTIGGTVIGKAIVSKSGNVVKEIEIIIKDTLEKLSYKDCFDRIVEKF